MTRPTVDHVLDLIERLPEEDRLTLEKRLAQRRDADWERTVAENRHHAQQQGITETDVDRAIHRRRYGE